MALGCSDCIVVWVSLMRGSGTGSRDAPVRVAHLVYSFAVGGLERVIVNLINASDPEKIQHVIITQVDNSSMVSQLQTPVDVYCINKAPGNDLSSHWRLYRVLREARPDVLHTYNFGTFEYHPVALLAGVKRRVHAEHGRDGEYDPTVRRRRTLVRRLLLPFIQHLIVVSPDLMAWARTDLRLAPPKLQLVLNGIDTDAFSVNREARGNVDIFTFIAVGRLVDVKNHQLLIDAFARALEKPECMHCHLRIVGDGPLKDALEQRIAALQLSDKVTLLGARDDIPALLASADAFVLSSDYEAMPMTALEAMASGLPVISTRVGGVENIIKQGETGWLVEANNVDAMANTLEKIVSKDDAVAAVAKQAKQQVNDQFSAHAMMRHYADLYGLNVSDGKS